MRTLRADPRSCLVPRVCRALAACFLVLVPVHASRLSAPSSDDRTALRALVERFFAAYPAKDLEGIMALWSEKAPTHSTRRAAMQQLFASTGVIETRGLTLRSVALQQQRARLRVVIEMRMGSRGEPTSAPLPSTPSDRTAVQPQSAFERRNLTLYCAKEEGAWKVWALVRSEDDLAAFLIGASTEERKRLLEADEELVTSELIRTLFNQGDRVFRYGSASQAIPIYRLAHAIAEQIDDKLWIATTAHNLGLAYERQGDYTQALASDRKALQQYEKLGDKITAAHVLGNIGIVHSLQGDYAHALEYQKEALKRFEALDHKPGIARTINSIGVVLEARGDLSAALAEFRKSRALYDTLSDKEGIAAAVHNIGNVFLARGDYDQAMAAYQESLTLRKTLDDPAAVAETLNNMGEVHRLRGDYSLALASYQQSLTLCEGAGDQAGITAALLGTANIHASRGDYPEAMRTYQRSLTLAESIGNQQGIVRAWHNIGNVHYSLGDYERAWEFFQKSLTLAQTLGMNNEAATALNNMGIVRRSQGDYRAALELYHKSLSLKEQVGDKTGVATALISASTVYTDQGNHDLALNACRKSLLTCRTLGNKALIATAWNNLGIVHAKREEFKHALDAYAESLGLQRALGNKVGIATTLGNLGIVYRLQGQYHKALASYRESLSLSEAMGDKLGTAVMLNNIAFAHGTQGDYRQTVDFAERAASLARSIGDADTLWRARFAAGQAYRALNQAAAARQALEEAITTIETLRTHVAGGTEQEPRFFEDRVDPYLVLVDLLATSGHHAEAFSYAERAKARVLLDLLESGRVRATRAMTREEQAQERQRKSELISLNTQIYREKSRPQPDTTRLRDLEPRLHEARRQFEAFRASLYAAHPEVQTRRGETTPLTLTGAAHWLRTESPGALVVLEYVVGDKQTWLFALHGHGRLGVYPVRITRQELQQHIETLRSSVRRKAGHRLGADAAMDAALRSLDRLLAPARDVLAKSRRVCVIPDDVLWEVPFAALKTADGRYLVEQSAIFYAPSVSALQALEEKGASLRQHPNGRVLALAPFAYPMPRRRETIQAGSLRDPFGPLPATLNEVTAISKVCRTILYVRGTATETRVRTVGPRAQRLHFATHAYFEPSQGMYSGILLAGEERGQHGTGGRSLQDGIWEAWEIAEFDLQADLVVLSACETARGQLSRGEGVMGFTWAFFVAGCPSTVVSQWKVADESTARLMAAFYQHLKAGRGKAEALRQAQLSLLYPKQGPHRHPFFWAPFVLVGNWQ